MSAAQVPETADERAALKKEIQQHLLNLGGDAKSRTVTLKYFMQEQNLPPLFIKKAMGRIGLEAKKPANFDAKKLAKEKLELQKKIRATLSSFDVIDHSAIHQLYDTLRKQGIKRRHIRTALYNVASTLRSKYGEEASKLLVSLIRGSPQQSGEKCGEPKKKQKVTENNQDDSKNKSQNKSQNKSKGGKNVSFTGHFESTGKLGRKIPPTPIVKKTPPSGNAPLVKKTPKTPPVAAIKSPEEKATLPAANSPPKNSLKSAKRPATTPLAAPGNEKKARIGTPAISPVKSAQDSQASDNQANQQTIKSSPSTPVVNKEDKPTKSPVNLNGSYIAMNSTGKKTSVVLETTPVNSKQESADVSLQSDKKEKTPKLSILKSDNSSGNKATGRRVSFGSVKSPEMKTPVNARKSINLIDLSTPASTTGIMDEECPSLVPINDGSTVKKKGKSPKFSPRLTRSAARKKVGPR